ncbi:MAG: hypothetical protein NTV09_04895 [Bacteroidetes bacterium]|nr:hypothetical protein [Bacteroidota bacterium]
MKNTESKMQKKQPESVEKIDLPGYPLYPNKDDIYNQAKEETEIDPEDITQLKVSDENTITHINIEEDLAENVTGDDLDVPGSELDDAQENIGSEDEENNYYSIGGDDHNDLEEDSGN